MTAPFIHLHVHSQYSLLDGAIRLDDLIGAARKFEMPSVAVTDHGTMFGAVEFYKKAKKAGVKPIIGVETYLSRTDRRDRTSPEAGVIYHLLLLAANNAGYRNLCAMVTKAYLEGFYKKPRIDKELLRKHSEGLIGLSACLQGEIPQALLNDDRAKARELALEYREILGEGNFYLELQENNLEAQNKVNAQLVELARELDLPLAATNDCHYLTAEDFRAHAALLCLQTGKTLTDDTRMKFETNEFYFKSPEEMAERFKYCPEALENTARIAERCEVEFDMKTFHTPTFPVPAGKSLDDMFEEDARRGFEERLPEIRERRGGLTEAQEEEYRDRLEEEIRLIKKMGFSGYFLIVADFIVEAKKRGIPVGPGRGSAAGSLAAYAMSITDIDPLPYDLLFERFLNPERKSMPDIDVDFCMNGRDEVIRYVSEKYGGAERVSQIITFGTLKAKAVIRDVGRVLDMPYGEVDKLAKLVPDVLGIKLKDALEKEPRLKEAAQADPRVADLLDLAMRLEGLTRHASTHAAGVVVSDKPLVEYAPLYRSQKDDSVVIQYDMKSTESIGLIKFDFLGLKTLTMIQFCEELVRKTKDPDFDVRRIPMGDAGVFELLARGDTAGVFQLESSGMRELVIRMKPNRFEDIIALVALYRPGPMGSGMHDAYVNRKHGLEAVKYELPELRPILDSTYGVILYQEQVMLISRALAGFSLGDADLLRRAMGKKDMKTMAEQKERFLQGAGAKKIDPGKAAHIFEQMEKFAEYGFNKSHSAAYALVSYQTAYLKAHYTPEFMASLLTVDRDNTDKVMRYLAECRDKGIEVRGPDVNASVRDFAVEADGAAIRFGLAAVKNVGVGAVDAIVAARNGEEGAETNGPFTSLFDLCSRADLRKVNRRVLESLVKAGALDSLGVGRATLLANLDRALERGQSLQRDRLTGQGNLFDDLGGAEAVSPMEKYEEAPEPPRMETLRQEHEVLGFYVSGHPLADYKEEIVKAASTDITSLRTAGGGKVRVAGMVGNFKEKRTRAGERMAVFILEDEKGTVEVTVFPKAYIAGEEALKSGEPVLVAGNLERSEEQVKILAEEATLLREASARAVREVHLSVSTVSVDEDRLNRLKDALSGYKGSCSTYLHLIIPGHSETILALPPALRVDPSAELRDRIERVLPGVGWGVA